MLFRSVPRRVRCAAPAAIVFRREQRVAATNTVLLATRAALLLTVAARRVATAAMTAVINAAKTRNVPQARYVTPVDAMIFQIKPRRQWFNGRLNGTTKRPPVRARADLSDGKSKDKTCLSWILGT